MLTLASLGDLLTTQDLSTNMQNILAEQEKMVNQIEKLQKQVQELLQS